MGDVELYDEVTGANKVILLGCTLKNITTQLGLGRQKTTATVTLIREEGQTFQLGNTITYQQGIGSLVNVEAGAFNFIGEVESFEETIQDINGKNIIVVKLLCARSILNMTTFMSRAVEEIGGLVYSSPGQYWGPNWIPLDVSVWNNPRDFDWGAAYDPIKEAIEQATLYYNGKKFKLDLSEVTEWIESKNAPTDSLSTWHIDNVNRDLTTFLMRLGFDFDFSWYVDMFPDSEDPNTIIIKVQVIGASYEDVPADMTFDKLAELHDNKVILRKEGLEGRPLDEFKSIEIMTGGNKHNLHEFTEADISSFWGWKQLTEETGPKGSVTQLAPEPQAGPGWGGLGGGDVPGADGINYYSEMIQIYNGTKEPMPDDDYVWMVKSYADKYWGRQFIIEVPEEWLGEGQILEDQPSWKEWLPGDVAWCTPVPEGWWENTGTPGGSLIESTQEILRNKDGRYRCFVELPDINKGASENPPYWDQVTMRSDNLIDNLNGKYYMIAKARMIERYIIVELPDPLITNQRLQPESLQSDILEDRVLPSKVWIPLGWKNLYYGPWTNVPKGDDPNIVVPVRGKTTYRSDLKLVPWMFGHKLVTNTEAMAKLEELAISKLAKYPESLGYATIGTIEVEGVPKVGLGLDFGEGGTCVTQISINYGVQGITTTYTVKLYTVVESDNPIRGTAKLIEEIVDEVDDREESSPLNINEIEDIHEIVEADPDPTSIPEPIGGEPTPLEGGMGVIVGPGSSWGGGPYYDIDQIEPGAEGSWVLTEGKFAVADWHNILNIGENLLQNVGYLPKGTWVHVHVHYPENPFFAPTLYIEQTPTTFAPPVGE